MAMAKSAEADDPSRHAATGTSAPARPKNGTADVPGIPPLVRYRRRREISEELRRWYSLDEAAQLEELRRAATGARSWSIEVLMHTVRRAYASGDRRAYVQTFNAFATRATPLLMRQARKHNAGEEEDHAQDVLLQTAKEVQAGKAEYAETNFADYAMRKAISARRRTDATLEGKLKRAEPITPTNDEGGDALDPLDEIADRLPSPEARALLSHAVGKLEGELRDVFIQYHVHGLTYREIAEHYDVDETTVSNWVKRANRLVGPWRER
jgi:RNA polymerase sigma factor (sigma-70 family)